MPSHMYNHTHIYRCSGNQVQNKLDLNTTRLPNKPIIFDLKLVKGPKTSIPS